MTVEQMPYVPSCCGEPMTWYVVSSGSTTSTVRPTRFYCRACGLVRISACGTYERVVAGPAPAPKFAI